MMHTVLGLRDITAPVYERLRERGLLTLEEAARSLGISTATAKQWRLAGLLRAHS